MRGSTNRFSDRSSGASKPPSKTGGAPGGTNPSGTSGLGSTSGSLLSSGGGGGGGGGGGSSSGASAFTLTLLEVAEPGSFVKKGDVVAEFDRQYQLNRIDDYKASLVQSEANIKQIQANLAIAKQAHDQLIYTAKADLEKAHLDMKAIEVVSAIDREKLKLAVEESEARYKQLLGEVKLLEISQGAELRSAEIERDQSKIELQQSENNAARMVLRAPIDGLVVMERIFRGGEFAQVQQGDQVYPGMMFMKIVDPSSMVVNGMVNQVDAEALRIGMRAKIQLDAYPEAEYDARVFSVGAMSKARMFRAEYLREVPVRLKIDAIDPRVIPDMSASADVIMETEKQAAVLPLASIFRDAGQPKPFAFVRASAGWERRELDLGLNNNVAVAVRSGLKPGERVAVRRPETERPGGQSPPS
ncbi:MAG: HlyD family efflux transporter periplasmic adaptor subunit [Bryobacteraceae bacterium]